MNINLSGIVSGMTTMTLYAVPAYFGTGSFGLAIVIGFFGLRLSNIENALCIIAARR